MSLAIKLFCALMVIGFAGLFVLKKPDGTPWLSLNEFMPDTTAMSSDAKDLISKAKGALNNKESEAATTQQGGIYRWKDTNGKWQFSDKPPSTNVAVERIEVSGDLNRDIAEKYTPQEKEASASITPASNSGNTSIIPSSLSPEKVEKLMQDANNVQTLLDERQSQMEKQLQ